MPKFRRKTTIVEANQFLHAATSPVGVRTEEDGRSYVMTIHKQKVYLEPGDWILPEGDGIHYYPVKPDIFRIPMKKFNAFRIDFFVPSAYTFFMEGESK